MSIINTFYVYYNKCIVYITIKSMNNEYTFKLKSQ